MAFFGKTQDRFPHMDVTGKEGVGSLIWASLFSVTLRDECLKVHWFLSMENAREKIERWRKDYNEFRPHSSLGDLTPQQFLDKFSTRIKSQKTTLLAGPVFG